MPSSCRISSLIPRGFVADSEMDIDDEIVLTVRAKGIFAPCPICEAPSRRIHSRYIRHVSDLPASGRLVRLHIVTRRFCCEAPQCPRRIFAERFDETVLPVRSRRTARLEGLVHHLGLALGGRPAAALAKRLMLPVSNDTLLRIVRRRARSDAGPLSVWHRRLGIPPKSSLWDDRLRSGAPTSRGAFARSGNHTNRLK